MDTLADSVVVIPLNDAQLGGTAIQVLPADPTRSHATFVTDGVVFIKPGNGTNLVTEGYALGVASAYGGGFKVTTKEAVYAVRYGAGTLRIYVEHHP